MEIPRSWSWRGRRGGSSCPTPCSPSGIPCTDIPISNQTTSKPGWEPGGSASEVGGIIKEQQNKGNLHGKLVSPFPIPGPWKDSKGDQALVQLQSNGLFVFHPIFHPLCHAGADAGVSNTQSCNGINSFQDCCLSQQDFAAVPHKFPQIPSMKLALGTQVLSLGFSGILRSRGLVLMIKQSHDGWICHRTLNFGHCLIFLGEAEGASPSLRIGGKAGIVHCDISGLAPG